jgi:hypothetical protein
VREYLEIDWEELERTCRQCPTAEADRDEDGYCSLCKRRSIEERFPVEFVGWAENLKRLWKWKKAGYDLGCEELSWWDWEALSYITRYYEMRDLQAALPTTPPQTSS